MAAWGSTVGDGEYLGQAYIMGKRALARDAWVSPTEASLLGTCLSGGKDAGLRQVWIDSAAVEVLKSRGEKAGSELVELCSVQDLWPKDLAKREVPLGALSAIARELSQSALSSTRAQESLSELDASWLCLQGLFEPDRAMWLGRAKSGIPAQRLAGVLAAVSRSSSPAWVVDEARRLGLVSAEDIGEALFAKCGELCLFDEAIAASDRRRRHLNREKNKNGVWNKNLLREAEQKISTFQAVMLVLAAVGKIGSEPLARTFKRYHMPYGELGLCAALFLGGAYEEAQALVGQGFEVLRSMGPAFVAESLANLHYDQLFERWSISSEKVWPEIPEQENMGASQRAFETLLLAQAAREEVLNVDAWVQEVYEQARLKCPELMRERCFKDWLDAFARRFEAALLGAVSSSSPNLRVEKGASTKKRL